MTEDHHRLPVILTLIKMLWGTKEVDSNPLSDLMHDRHKNAQNRKRFLEVLDQFIYSSNDPPAIFPQVARMDAMHRIQTIHMAHLIGAGNMMDWLYSLLRAGPDVDNAARMRMERWAAQDPVRVREVAYRSAQVLSMIRQYPYNLPQEPFNIFHAGAVLWCVADLLSSGSNQGTAATMEGRRSSSVCQIDHLGAAEAVDIRHWVQHGGSQRVSLYGVPDLCSNMGRQQVLEQTVDILRRMHVWGIAQNFLEVVLGLLQKAEESQV